MKITTTFTIGEVTYKLEIEEQKEMETIHKAAVLSNPPKRCDVCSNTHAFSLVSSKDQKGNIYADIKCMSNGCGAKAKLGQYQVGGYFWHRFKQWQPQQQVSEAHVQQQPPQQTRTQTQFDSGGENEYQPPF